MKSITIFDSDKLVIRNDSLVTKYESFYEEFYIPPQEDDTFDPESMVLDSYIKSREQIGYHHPIEVAIWEDDPNKNKKDSEFRVHLRIIDGRHRWRQSIKHGIRWPVKFYSVSDYNQYMILRSHFDLKKDTNPNERIKFFEHLCKYYENVLKIPKPRVCSAICNDYSPSPFHEATIRRYVSTEYKDMQKMKGNIASLPTRQTNSIAEIIKKKPHQIRNDYARYKHVLTRLYKENEYLRAQLGVGYFEGVRYIVEVKKENIWNFVKLFEDEKEAISFIKDSGESLRLIEQHVNREIKITNNNKRVVEVKNEQKRTHEYNSDSNQSTHLVLMSNRLFRTGGRTKMNCTRCNERIVIGQRVVSKGRKKSTNHKYYCVPCGQRLMLI